MDIEGSDMVNTVYPTPQWIKDIGCEIAKLVNVDDVITKCCITGTITKGLRKHKKDFLETPKVLANEDFLRPHAREGTGHKDSHGNEIIEGDILSNMNSGELCLVSYSETDGRYILKRRKRKNIILTPSRAENYEKTVGNLYSIFKLSKLFE
jgi:hypothetical protein